MTEYMRPALDGELAQKVANTLRFLSADGVQAANSGHPGLPMGCADIATVLLTQFLRIDPNDPDWINRDRFILSAGHGSMLLYSMLALSGILEIDDLRNFRQFGSRTPGHPEAAEVPGVDVTSGPLAAGFATGAGLAIAERMLAERFNKRDLDVIDHFTYVLMGDGCNMEGLSQEAASLAGHLKLSRLIAIYDDNEISIEGSTDLAFTENVNARYEALGWQVQDIDGHDRAAIAEAILAAQRETERPSLIVAHTTIGQGAPNKAGTASAHGEPLGEEELAAAKEAMGWSGEKFHVPDEVAAACEQLKDAFSGVRREWDDLLATYSGKNKSRGRQLARIIAGELPSSWKRARPTFEPGDDMATRASGGKVLNAFAEAIDELVGGSADLEPSNKTNMKTAKYAEYIEAGSLAGRNIHFGVREHAMGHIVNGLALHGLVPFGATFMVFHDYMRPAVRMAALTNLRTIWVYTHDSIFVGEDGPTHQPVEQLAAIRAIPRVHVMRPADANEVAYAWQYALERADGPTALALTRQTVPTLDRRLLADAKNTLKGGYVLERDPSGKAEILLIATGSEVSLAMEVAAKLRAADRAVQVVSMPCLELFARQADSYRRRVLPKRIKRRVVLEAGVIQGWEGILGDKGIFVGMDDFGQSGPYQALAEKYGFVADAVIDKINAAGF